jgi:DNA polymerase III delta prime subunit
MSKPSIYKTHNERYEIEQDKYYAATNKRDKDEALIEMYNISKEICRNYIKKYCESRNLHIDYDEKATEAADWILELYLRHSDFKIEKISAYAYFAKLKALFSNINEERNIDSLDELQDKENHSKNIY